MDWPPALTPLDPEKMDRGPGNPRLADRPDKAQGFSGLTHIQNPEAWSFTDRPASETVTCLSIQTLLSLSLLTRPKAECGRRNWRWRLCSSIAARLWMQFWLLQLAILGTVNVLEPACIDFNKSAGAQGSVKNLTAWFVPAPFLHEDAAHQLGSFARYDFEIGKRSQ